MSIRYLRDSAEDLRTTAFALLSHRQLAVEMARREIRDRYVGQSLGSLWAIFHPLFQIGLYVFIFAFVFKVRVGGTASMPLDYTTYILAGLIPWIAMQESMVKSCLAVTSNSNLVKQVVFPLEVLPFKGVLASMLPQVIGTTVLIVYVLVHHGSLHWTYVLLPLLVGLQIIWMLGLAYLFSCLGVFIRDLKDVVQVFSAVGVYLIPAFYLPDMVPNAFRPLLYINPFSYMIWCYQDVVYFGRFEHPYAWAVFGIISVGTLVLGVRMFARLKPTLAGAL
jgi:lipopolysaccharide transport system permease protein